MRRSCNTGLAGGPSRLDLRDPAQRLPDLIALVEGTGADIVGLQEVTSRHRARPSNRDSATSTSSTTAETPPTQT